MAELQTLARPYAKAVFEIAQAEKAFPAWTDHLTAMAEVVANDQIAPLVTHPAVTGETLLSIVTAVIGKPLSAEATAFLKLLIENRRLGLVPVIAEQYAELRAAAEARVDVTITSASAVDKAQQQLLADAIGKRLQRTVSIEWASDPELLGGAIISAGDLVIDGSLAGELERMKSALGR